MTNTAEIRHRAQPVSRLVPPTTAAIAKVSIPSGTTDKSKLKNPLVIEQITGKRRLLATLVNSFLSPRRHRATSSPDRCLARSVLAAIAPANRMQ
jgi:hypothetical protein